MPELPEVQTIVAYLTSRLRGAVIESARLCRRDVIHHGPRALARVLRGKHIRDVGREAKRILVEFDDRSELVVHLGMSGRLTIEPASHPPLIHTHFRARLAGRPDELRFRDPRRFGGLWYFESAEQRRTVLSPVGPDALTLRVPVLRSLCRRHRPIKALLLDQTLIAGLGNIYCDEALHAVGIHPLTPAAALDEPSIRKLACSIRSVLRRAIDSGGSTLREYRNADGAEGRFQDVSRVYGRTGEPCPRCGVLIERILAAGRSSHICPRCQPRDDAIVAV